ncbi:hypothetical protein GGR21_003661 [Dysgonomonas hofstadii]|uniref:BACON domain-containing protein n=1 Tax=Dysgonomonas hofstadii TaxID=637886 RepID=A0A840CP07_9BACT|nr:BACON domain-containing protein [Dysgonomonas hofstadii]MBB4037740.1 hypothetical protein [Dysgonomonas hofstadii]
MKKLLIILMSLAAIFTACGDSNDNAESFENQEISISAANILLDMEGISTGSSSAVTVTSTADWRLTGDLSWVTASATKGSNGTTVTFSAATNDTGEEREVNLHFICGNATQKLTVKQLPEEIVEFTKISDSYTMATAGGRITVMVNTNLDVFNTDISEDWVTIRAEKDDSETKWVQFVFEANTTFYDRTVEITMFKGTDWETSFTVTQTKFTGVIISGTSDFEFGVAGGTATVTATGNVNFNPSITTANAVWISAVETSSTGTDIITKTFEITCAAGNWTRSGVVTISPASGTSATVNISQVDPNPELFDVPDAVFAARLVALGYIVAKDNKYYMTYSGYTATSLSFSSSAYSAMESVAGIERFENLTSFSLYYSDVKKLDLSNNTKITTLTLSYIPIEELILGDMNRTSLSLTYLYNYYNNSNCAESFTISSSKLTSLTLNMTSSYYASYEKVEWIDITGCPAMTTVTANRYGGKLKTVYVTQAQKDAYDAGTLKITNSYNTMDIVVK